MNILLAPINWLVKRWFHYCIVHKRKLEIWSGPKDKLEFGIIAGHIECLECHPELFKEYFKNLQRFNIELGGDIK